MITEFYVKNDFHRILTDFIPPVVSELLLYFHFSIFYLVHEGLNKELLIDYGLGPDKKDEFNT